MKWIIGLAVVTAMAVAGVTYATTSKVAIPPVPKLGAPLTGNATTTTPPGVYHNVTPQAGAGAGSSPSAPSGVGGSGTSGSDGAGGGSGGGAAPSGGTPGAAAAPAPVIAQPAPVATAPPATVVTPPFQGNVTCAVTTVSQGSDRIGATFAIATNWPNAAYQVRIDASNTVSASGNVDASGNATFTIPGAVATYDAPFRVLVYIGAPGTSGNTTGTFDIYASCVATIASQPTPG